MASRHVSLLASVPADPFNFAPRVHAPTLMINGRHDYFFDLETSQKPLFELLGTPPGDKVHLLFDSGHIASEREHYTAEILRWLDRYLGPVRSRDDLASPPSARAAPARIAAPRLMPALRAG